MSTTASPSARALRSARSARGCASGRRLHEVGAENHSQLALLGVARDRRAACRQRAALAVGAQQRRTARRLAGAPCSDDHDRSALDRERRRNRDPLRERRAHRLSKARARRQGQRVRRGPVDQLTGEILADPITLQALGHTCACARVRAGRHLAPLAGARHRRRTLGRGLEALGLLGRDQLLELRAPAHRLAAAYRDRLARGDPRSVGACQRGQVRRHIRAASDSGRRRRLAGVEGRRRRRCWGRRRRRGRRRGQRCRRGHGCRRDCGGRGWGHGGGDGRVVQSGSALRRQQDRRRGCGRSGRRRRRSSAVLFVVDVHARLAGHRLDLHERVLEEPQHAARQPVAPAHDDRLCAEVPLNPRNQLVDRASAVGAGSRVGTVAEPRASLAPERLEQLPRRAHAWMTPIVSTSMPGAISL